MHLIIKSHLAESSSLQSLIPQAVLVSAQVTLTSYSKAMKRFETVTAAGHGHTDGGPTSVLQATYFNKYSAGSALTADLWHLTGCTFGAAAQHSRVFTCLQK